MLTLARRLNPTDTEEEYKGPVCTGPLLSELNAWTAERYWCETNEPDSVTLPLSRLVSTLAFWWGRKSRVVSNG